MNACFASKAYIMKRLLYFIFLVATTSLAQVGIGTTNPDASSALDIQSTSAGILVPRMTQAQRDAIGSPADGLLIYQTDNSPGFYYYNGAWTALATSGGSGEFQSVSGLVQNTTNIGSDDFVFGDTDLNGGGAKFFLDTGKGAFRAGIAGGSEWNDANVGSESIALGSLVTASAANSAAFGFSAEATGANATAFTGGIASGDNSVAYLFATASGESSFAWSGNASGQGAISLGGDASGASSMALMGGEVTSAGTNGFSFGSGASTAGTSAISMGDNASASGTNATALGFGANASGGNAMAFTGGIASGDNSVGFVFANATGQGSFAWSGNASGQGAISLGGNASGASSMALMGGAVTAAGTNGFSFGSGASTAGVSAISMGDNASASGTNATALGFGANASGGNATAFTGGIASGDNSVAFPFATASGQSAFAWSGNASGVGAISFGGTYTLSLHDALPIYRKSVV